MDQVELRMAEKSLVPVRRVLSFPEDLPVMDKDGAEGVKAFLPCPDSQFITPFYISFIVIHRSFPLITVSPWINPARMSDGFPV